MLLGVVLFIAAAVLTGVAWSEADDYDTPTKYAIVLVGLAAQGVGLIVAALGSLLGRD